MASGNKIKSAIPYLLFASLILGLGTFAVKGLKLLNFGETASWGVDKIHELKLKGGLLGYVSTLIDISIDNPTDTMVGVKKPFVKAFIDKTSIGNSIPSPDITNIQPNARTIIKDIEVQMPVSKLIPIIPGIVQKILNGEKMGKTVDLDITLDVDGKSFSKTVNFDI